MRLGKRTSRLVREAMVLGFAEGACWGGYRWDREYPADTEVQDRVFKVARSLNDLYPLLSKVEGEGRA